MRQLSQSPRRKPNPMATAAASHSRSSLAVVASDGTVLVSRDDIMRDGRWPAHPGHLTADYSQMWRHLRVRDEILAARALLGLEPDVA